MRQKYKLKHNWTKKQVMAQVKAYNNGKRAVEIEEIYPDVWESIPVYRTRDGNRDPIGCFVMAGHPGLNYNGSCDALLEACPDLMKFMPFESVEALVRMQEHHDLADSIFKGSVWDAMEQFLKLEVEE